MLTTTEHVDVLVDDSSPEEGVVFEGPVDSNDIDYTSDDYFIVHWHGFIDHESGIKLYRIGLADICLTREDFYNISELNASFTYKELPFQITSVRLPANFTGKRFVTVLALNNAMEASNPVCSDGITRDMSAPGIRNVTLQNAAWSESIVCHKGQPYLLHSNLKKVPLNNTMICSNLCNAKLETAIGYYLPTYSAASKDEEISNFLCRNLPFYKNESIIFLPTDHIVLEWDVEESGSQIEDFFVGFGLDATETNSPSLVDYMSTQRKPFFRRKHEGIGTNELFNIFIKTVNKAGLSSISTLGPILIDQTPPLYNNIPKVTFEESHIMFAWESNTFYDDEQIAQINQIIFQLGHDEMAVSPLLEWRLNSSSPCPPYSGGCIRYPFSRLQNQDTGDGLQFHLNIHIYNNAGHFTSIKTEKFRLPSRYTPGKGIVFDIDPEETNTSTDIDIHFTENVLCACWMGFKHHENVSLEVGIGSNSTTADVVEFKSISSDINQFCFNSRSVVNIEVNFFLIRANCSGGSTISSSNGVKIYQRQTLESELRVKIGPNCLSNFEYRTNVSLNNYSNIAILPFSLSIGQRYALLSEGEGLENINIYGSDCTINKHANVYYLTPFTEKPILQIKHSYLTEQKLLLQVIRCPFESNQPISNQVNISWILTNLTNQGLLFSVGLFEVLKDNGSVMENEVVPFQTPVDANSYTFLYISLDEEISYHAKVRICNNVRCLRPIKSNIFTVDKEAPRISITSAELKVKAAGDCVQLTASWEFTADVKRIGFFQWSLSRDDKGSHLLSVWNNVLSTGSSELKVNFNVFFNIVIIYDIVFHKLLSAYNFVSQYVAALTILYKMITGGGMRRPTGPWSCTNIFVCSRIFIERIIKYELPEDDKR
ncbi:hypothetical protein DPMN_068218 [Dreissena polymorpha]|uniref:Uncharacterized protein n=1 Tax=Dreissena polymorpha TaxID=45954 RepID=A0A9D3YZF3_DREPO|nr:hypothetical protein DPMN_068218 [Dreissena polymorpha]